MALYECYTPIRMGEPLPEQFFLVPEVAFMELDSAPRNIYSAYKGTRHVTILEGLILRAWYMSDAYVVCRKGLFKESSPDAATHRLSSPLAMHKSDIVYYFQSEWPFTEFVVEHIDPPKPPLRKCRHRKVEGDPKHCPVCKVMFPGMKLEDTE